MKGFIITTIAALCGVSFGVFGLAYTAQAADLGYDYYDTSYYPSTGYDYYDTSYYPSTGYDYYDSSYYPSSGYDYYDTSYYPSHDYSYQPYDYSTSYQPSSYSYDQSNTYQQPSYSYDYSYPITYSSPTSYLPVGYSTSPIYTTSTAGSSSNSNSDSTSVSGASSDSNASADVNTNVQNQSVNENNNPNTNVNENVNNNVNEINIVNEINVPQPQPIAQASLYQQPTCTIFANPSSVEQGGSTTLMWSSSNATSATLTDAGAVSTSGTRSYSNLTTTRTFVLNVVGPGGSNSCSATVGVHSTPVTQQGLTCTLQVNPTSVRSNESAVLNWTSTNAVSAMISDGIGSVATNGFLTVRPEGPRTYSLTVRDAQGNQKYCTAYLNVTKSPHVSLSAVPYTGFDGGPFGNMLYWIGLFVWAAAAGYLLVYYRGGIMNYFSSVVADLPVITAAIPHLAHSTGMGSYDTPTPTPEFSSGGQIKDSMRLEDGSENGMPRITIAREKHFPGQF